MRSQLRDIAACAPQYQPFGGDGWTRARRPGRAAASPAMTTVEAIQRNAFSLVSPDCINREQQSLHRSGPGRRRLRPSRESPTHLEIVLRRSTMCIGPPL
jgi:hypothetical protein